MLNALSKLTCAGALAAMFAVPAPAQADADDVARAIAGIAAVAIIAKAIDNRSDRSGSAVTAASNGRVVEYATGTPDRRRIIDGRISRYDGYKSGKKRRGYKKLALPNRCLRVIETRRGSRYGYGDRCLQRNYRHANKLPNDCETRVRTRNGVRTIFGARCLARDGWRVARH